MAALPNESLYHSLYSHSREGIVKTDSLFRIEYMNSAAEALLGYSLGDSKGKPPDILLDSIDPSRIDPDILSSLRSGQAVTKPIHIERDEESALHISLYIYPLSEEKDSLSGYFLSLIDITARQELMEARKKAEEASRAKSEFIATMSHEIRTPMNGVLGMAELLSLSSLNRQQRQYLEELRTSAESLLEIINDVLDFSRIEAKKLDVRIIPFGIRDTVEQSLNIVAQRAFEKGLGLFLYFDPSLPDAYQGDPTRIRQILINFLSNAIKFTPKGEVSLRVSRGNSPGEENWIRFDVHDTGIGIAPEKQQLIFNAFTQGDGTITRRYGGTGLGLTISHHLAELMKGYVSFHSRENGGSNFSLLLPLSPESRSGESTEGYAEAVEVVAGLKDMDFLVIDGHRERLEGTTAILSYFGIPHSTVETPIEAMQHIDGDPGKGVDAIILYPSIPVEQILPVIKNLQGMTKGSGDVAFLLAVTPEEYAELTENEGLPNRVYPMIKPVGDIKLLSALKELHLDRQFDEESVKTGDMKDTLKPPHEKKRVLIVEDNPTTILVTSSLLQHLGYLSESAPNGETSLELTEHYRYDAILMDIQMSDMDGYRVTEEMRNRGVATPIIGLSAHALKPELEKAFEAGMNDYISKPFQKKTLERILRKWLD